MPGRTDRHWRSVGVLGFLVVFAAVAVLRLAYWQVVMGPDLTARAQAQLQQTTTEPSVRGRILDRNGDVLAMTGYRDTLAAWPDQIDPARRPGFLESLGAILGLDAAGTAELDKELDPKLRYAVIRRELNEDESQQVRNGIADGSLAGLVLEPHAVRIYPMPGGQPGTTLASQLLGFVRTSDGTGHYGIEQQYDSILAGVPRRVAVARDRYSRPLESSELVLDPGVDGRDIQLSIDASLQLQLEKELFLAWTTDRAQRVSGLVMDPTTGQILAWASVPGYDANDITGAWADDPKIFQDPIVSQFYEPGSVMKMLTATAALQTGAIKPSSTVVDSAAIHFGPDRVRNSDHLGMGRIPFKDVIAYSRNVAVSKVAKRLGRTTGKASQVLYRTWQRLGIGKLTGVDVAGEVAGIAVDPRNQPWAPIDLANRSFGQAVAVTPIQLATAFTPMLNGGLHVQPHFLTAVGGQAQPTPPTQRVIPRKTAKQTRALLKHVTDSVSYYAAGSLIRRYEVGGKTGTAQIWRQSTKQYDPDTFNFSFVGYVGGDEPQAVVAIRIAEANPVIKKAGDLRLNITSYQLFRRVARDTIPILDIHRSSDPDAGLPERGSMAERILQPKRFAERHREEGRQ
jgi:cell division protein FtsI/penicillin-binding protein 2